MKKSFLYLVWSTLFFPLHSFASANDLSLKKIQENKILKVCSDAGFLPFEMMTSEGEWTGYDIDMMKDFAANIGVRLNMVQYEFSGIIPALISNKCDMIAAGMTVTPERSEVLLFSDTVFINGISIVLKNTPENLKIKSLHDLDNNNIKIGVKTGYTSDIFLTSQMRKAQITRFNLDSNLLLGIMENRIQALATDTTYVRSIQKNYKDKLISLPIKLPVQKFSVAAKKRDVALIHAFNAFFKKWSKSGQRDAVIKKYF